MTAEILNLRDRMQAQLPLDHGCLGDRNGGCALCQIRSLDEYRQQKVQLPCDVEPVKDFAE